MANIIGLHYKVHVRDRAWFVRLYGEISTVQAHKPCTTITSVDLAHYGVSRAKDWVSVHCGTSAFNKLCMYKYLCF